MTSFKPTDDTDVMPLVLRLLRGIGVWDVPRYRYRYVAVFLFYVFGILIPKLCFGYPTLEASIRGYTELILETNVFAGMLQLYLCYNHFVPLVDELRAFAAIVFQDNQPMLLRTNLTNLNLRIHKYTLCYCLYMCCVCTVYCVAPLGSNIAGYIAAMRDTASNSSSTTFAFTLYLEQGFYWLDNRTSLLGYCVCTVFMFPLMYLCAYTATVKVVAVFNMIKYCQTVLRIVVLKLRLLETQPDVRQRSDGMSESINVGQALYASGWYEYDVQMRNNISFMIMRSQRRVGLTAAKFCFVDMEQFGAMLNMSYSFFVVLKDAF
uniref:Odorant receptor n=1 Tax=Anopheles melas TaxID=34690 RepID=A0A182TKS7_9DIPT